jgi:hypothetical protein
MDQIVTPAAFKLFGKSVYRAELAGGISPALIVSAGGEPSDPLAPRLARTPAFAATPPTADGTGGPAAP